MTTPQVLREVVSPALVRGVGYALLHSLWQGGVLALLLAGALPLLRRHRAEVRYAVAAGALAALVLAVGLTFGFYYRTNPAVASQPIVSGVVQPAVTQAAAAPVSVAAVAAGESLLVPPFWLRAMGSKIEPYLSLIVVAWLLGLLLMSGRLAGGLLYAGRLRRAGTQALGADWQQRLAVLARRAGVRQPVALLESARVVGPLVLGHLRPAILLPLGAVAGLSPALLEALLAHELAHIVRRDYLLNLGLAVAEVLFFYHPAVWFMANCLRVERENCCDDQAATLCGGDRLRVARALAALAELEATMQVPQLALAAAGAGGRGSLLARVRRLALGRPQAPTLGEGLLAMLLGVLGVAGLSTGVALAAPVGNKTVKVLTAIGKQTVTPADTTRKPKIAGATAVLADTVRHQVRVLVDTDTKVNVVPRVRTYSFSQQGPPRRERASTVVIEKDKKGRVVNLTVDGQPVETAPAGKKAKHSKAVRTVEVVQVPSPAERPERLQGFGRLERPERPENQDFSFDFSTEGFGDEVQQSARRGITDALRNPDLTTEQRQAMEKALRSLGEDKVFRHFDNQPFSLRYSRNGLAKMKVDKEAIRQHLRYDFRTLDGTTAAADQAERNARQAERNAGQAERNAREAEYNAQRAEANGRLAEANAQRAEANSRRIELRARIDAAEAELRALDQTSGRGSFRPAPRAPRPPMPPQGPMTPMLPLSPQGPLSPVMPPPPPPSPNTAKLRAELRRDGIIQDDKHFTFELNDQGGKANGKALTPAQVAKYRQLLNKPASKGKGKSTFSISINEDEN